MLTKCMGDPKEANPEELCNLMQESYTKLIKMLSIQNEYNCMKTWRKMVF